MRTHTDDDLLQVMNWIKDLNIKLSCKESSHVVIEEVDLVQNQGTKILDPTAARSKGRPPSKRKSSKVDQIVKKKIAGKNTQNCKKKSSNYQSQEEVMLKIFKFIFLVKCNSIYIFNFIFFAGIMSI